MDDEESQGVLEELDSAYAEEYLSLNTVIDEIDSYMDVLEARTDHLYSKLSEMLEDTKRERLTAGSSCDAAAGGDGKSSASCGETAGCSGAAANSCGETTGCSGAAANSCSAGAGDDIEKLVKTYASLCKASDNILSDISDISRVVNGSGDDVSLDKDNDLTRDHRSNNNSEDDREKQCDK